MLETVNDAVYLIEPDWTISVFNSAAERHFEVARAEVLGRSVWEVFPQGVGTEYERACRRAMDAREATDMEVPSVLRPGRVVGVKIVPAPGAGVLVTVNDITERRRAEKAFRAERDRNAEILESISDAFFAVDDAWRLTYVNRVAEAWWGRARGELLGRSIWEVFPQAVGSDTYHAQHEAMRTRKVVRMEAFSAVVGCWIDISVFPGETGLAVYFRDISERKQAERRQRLLVNELNHRVKNSLAVVQAIARQTLREGRDMTEAREALTNRLVALAAAHDVVTRERWTDADLHEVIARAVLKQLDRPERIDVEGPSVRISAKLALSLSLALHELVTNALKYGALGAAAGRVSLQWETADTETGPRLRLTWRESGGPPVASPERAGFGSRLLGRALAEEVSGAVRLRFDASGVVCEIDAALADGHGSDLLI